MQRLKINEVLSCLLFHPETFSSFTLKLSLIMFKNLTAKLTGMVLYLFQLLYEKIFGFHKSCPCFVIK